MRAALTYKTNNYDPVYEVDTDNPATSFNERREYHLEMAAQKTFSSKTKIGARIHHIRFDSNYAETTKEDVNELVATFLRNIGGRTSVYLEGGVFRRIIRDEETGERVVTYDLEVKPAFGLTIGMRGVDVTILAERSPSGGDGWFSTSVDTTAGVRLTSNTSGRWNWSTYLRYQYRGPTDPTVPPLTARNVGFSVGWVAASGLGVDVLGRYSDQVESDQTAYEVRAGLIWYPRSRGRRGR
jgi:hypothetical protein